MSPNNRTGNDRLETEYTIIEHLIRKLLVDTPILDYYLLHLGGVCIYKRQCCINLSRRERLDQIVNRITRKLTLDSCGISDGPACLKL